MNFEWLEIENSEKSKHKESIQITKGQKSGSEVSNEMEPPVTYYNSSPLG